MQALRTTYNKELSDIDTELRRKYNEIQTEANNNPVNQNMEAQINELQLQMENRQKAAEKIYIESVMNLPSPVDQQSFMNIINKSKTNYLKLKSDPKLSGLFNKENGFPQEYIIYWSSF